MRALLKIIISAACVGCMVLCAMGQPTQTKPTPTQQKERIYLKPQKSVPILRPKAPSRQLISCEYDGENLLFEFELPEGMCELVLTDVLTAQTTAYVFDSSTCNAAVYVGEIYESTLTLTTSLGNVYSGTLSALPQ